MEIVLLFCKIFKCKLFGVKMIKDKNVCMHENISVLSLQNRLVEFNYFLLKTLIDLLTVTDIKLLW